MEKQKKLEYVMEPSILQIICYISFLIMSWTLTFMLWNSYLIWS